MPKPAKRKVLFQSVKSLIAQAQQAVVRNVNTTMLLTYFEIGRMIVENEQNGKGRADYAKEVLITLSNDLTAEFGRGYSVSNLEYMVGFYKKYQARLYPGSPSEIKRLTNTNVEKSQTVSGKLKKMEIKYPRHCLGNSNFRSSSHGRTIFNCSE